jgi:hypothetical protein
VGITFEANRENACCLCGSGESLTGEHKVKASALREEFGTDKMVIGHFDDPDSRVRLAQSAKSKAFHFNARMCSACNGARTQAADREFDQFHKAARKLLDSGADPKLVFEDQRYAVGSAAYLKIFRYFAKLLCCHMAEVSAPRPWRMSRFAIGQLDANCVWLDVDEDWTFRQIIAEHGVSQYAAHGGLVVYGNKRTKGANAFHSTLTVGPLRYVFFFRLNWLERLELRLVYREFDQWCRKRVEEAVDQPLSQQDRLRLGFAEGEQETA